MTPNLFSLRSFQQTYHVREGKSHVAILDVDLVEWFFGAPCGQLAQFRGPNFNGFSAEANLPSSWSQTENVVWATELPGASAASPVVWEDRVFISSADAENNTLVAMCLDRKTGNVLWQHVVAKGIRRDSRSNFAAPTPATDGDVVVFFYGSGPMVAFDMNGDVRWKRNIADDYGEFAFQWTFSTSPLLYDGKLYLQVLQRDTAVRGRGASDRTNESYLLALYPKTGDEIFASCVPAKQSKNQERLLRLLFHLRMPDATKCSSLVEMPSPATIPIRVGNCGAGGLGIRNASDTGAWCLLRLLGVA